MKELTLDQWNKKVDEMLENDKKLAGTIAVPGKTLQEYMATAPADNVITAKMISDYDRGVMGDLNPLYNDPEYGRLTRWGSIIAPPSYILKNIDYYWINSPKFPGFSIMDAGAKLDYSSKVPIRPGDEIRCQLKYLGMTDKSNPKKPYRLFYMSSQATYFNQRDEEVGSNISSALCVGTPPGEKAQNTFGERDIRKLTPDEVEMITQFYEDEVAGKHRRGANTLYWEDVTEGEAMQEIIEGPLSVLDVASFGSIFGAFAGCWPMTKSQIDRALIDPETGMPQPGIIWHYSNECARAVGVPNAIAFGPQTTASLAHLVTNWMGDDGWVKTLETQNRAARVFGEPACLKGEVVKKYIDKDGDKVVDLNIRSENLFNGMKYATGIATVKLVSKA